MKVVLQCELNDIEKALDDIEDDDVIIDQETYCHFRDDLFITPFREYIEKNHPGELGDAQTGGSDVQDGARKFMAAMHDFEVMHKYYTEYCKVRQRFYNYGGSWYAMDFLGFGNIGNEVSLIKLDDEEIGDLLNNQKERPFSKIQEIRRAIAGLTTRLRESMHLDLSAAPMDAPFKKSSWTYSLVTVAAIGSWFTEAWLLVLCWRWFLVPLGVSDITYAHGFGIYLLFSFLKLPNYRKKQPHEDSGLEYWKSYAFHAYLCVVFVLALAWPTHLLVQKMMQ